MALDRGQGAKFVGFVRIILRVCGREREEASEKESFHIHVYARACTCVVVTVSSLVYQLHAPLFAIRDETTGTEDSATSRIKPPLCIASLLLSLSPLSCDKHQQEVCSLHRLISGTRCSRLLRDEIWNRGWNFSSKMPRELSRQPHPGWCCGTCKEETWRCLLCNHGHQHGRPWVGQAG